MDIAHVVPIPLLRELILPTQHTHWVNPTIVLRDEEYAAFHRNRSERGDRTILDCREADPATVESACRRVRPKELAYGIYPDSYTVIELVPGEGQNEAVPDNLLLIPGAPTWPDYCMVIERALEHLDSEGAGVACSAIGIGREVVSLYGLWRLDAAEMIQAVFRMPVHLVGVLESADMVTELTSPFTRSIRSLNTARLAVWGLLEFGITRDVAGIVPPYPGLEPLGGIPGYFYYDQASPKALAMARENVLRWRDQV